MIDYMTAADKKIIRDVERWLNAGLTWEEMGERLGVTPATVYCLYSRALRRLAQGYNR